MFRFTVHRCLCKLYIRYRGRTTGLIEADDLKQRMALAVSASWKPAKYCSAVLRKSLWSSNASFLTEVYSTEHLCLRTTPRLNGFQVLNTLVRRLELDQIKEGGDLRYFVGFRRHFTLSSEVLTNRGGGSLSSFQMFRGSGGWQTNPPHF